MNLKKTSILTIILSIIIIGAWELYWRSKKHNITLNDDKALWAMQRAKLENPSNNQVVIIGSSRAYFDIQLKEWQQLTGKQPIQLSSTGSSPLPTFHDIVNNTNFKGTVIVGVTPGLFFSTTFPQASPWKRAQSKVDYFKKRTYAQRLNFMFSLPLQQNLVFMSADEEEWADDIDLKSLLRLIKIGNRIGKDPQPPFYNFGKVDIDRNMSMIPRVSKDSAYANSIKKVWQFFGKTAPPPDKEATMAFFLKDAQKFRQRGGNLVLLRCPSSGYYKDVETKFFSRKEYWDKLVNQTKAKSYHYEDYEQLKYFKCPEWSHLTKPDAIAFTTALANIMLNDKAFSNQKIN